MKVAASDYDNTIRVNSRVEPEALEAIHAWRAAGNVFGLATCSRLD